MCSFLFQAAKNPFCFVFIFSKQLPLNYFGGLHFNNPSVPSSRPPPPKKKSPGVDCLYTRMKSTDRGGRRKDRIKPFKERLIWTGHRFDLTKVYEYSRPVNSRNHLEAVEILNAVLNTVGRRLVSFLNGTFYNLGSGVLFFFSCEEAPNSASRRREKCNFSPLRPKEKERRTAWSKVKPSWLKISLGFHSEHPEWDQNLQFPELLPLGVSETTNILIFFTCEPPQKLARNIFFFFIPQIL